MIIFNLMEDGYIIQNMAKYGYHGYQDFVLIPQEDIGHILIMDGHGFPIMTGVGRLFIMDVGRMNLHMVGFGFPDMNGDPHGLVGEQVMIIMVGHHLLRM